MSSVTQRQMVASLYWTTEWKDGMEPYYPVNDEVNSALYAKY